MPLVSLFFRGDKRLAACQVKDSAHVLLGDKGDFVSKIQIAIGELDNSRISNVELQNQFYGKSTAKAVLNYKIKRKIINRSYQTKEDNIVGKMTITRLDAEMAQLEAKGGRRVKGQECCGAPPGAVSPKIAPQFRSSARSLAVGGPSFPNLVFPSLTKISALLRINMSYTSAGFQFSGGRHDAMITRAAELLLKAGVVLTPDPIDQIADWDKIDVETREDVFRIRNTAQRLKPNVPANVLRIIVCPFKPTHDQIVGLTDGGDRRGPNGEKYPPFCLLNASITNKDNCTLLHEMIHTTGLGFDEHSKDPLNVFAEKSLVRENLEDAHAIMLADGPFGRKILQS